jgi:Ca2+-binding EF-hand superfamily protein
MRTNCRSQHTIKQTLTDINPEWCTEGIHEETFRKLAMVFDMKSEQEIIYEAYKELDKLNRGYISADQFKNMMSNLLPHINPSNFESLFAAADMYQMGKVGSRT